MIDQGHMTDRRNREAAAGPSKKDVQSIFFLKVPAVCRGGCHGYT